jgi:PAS domain S-box-containing protein
MAGVFAEHYRTLFEHARDIVLMIDAETGVIIDANCAAELAYGYSRDELVGRTIFDLRIEPASAVGAQMRVADAGGTLFETLHRRRDGTTFPVEVSSRGDTIDGRRVLFSIIRDITTRRELETLRDEFLMLASHELRTPVSNIGLRLQQLIRNGARGGTLERALADARVAHEELRRLTHLVDTLLDAQVARGKIELARSEVDLAVLAGMVAERLRGHAERAGCSLAVEASEVTGSWDRARLEQILTNLIINAVKYGGGKPVHVRVTATDHEARIEVTDQGIGLARGDLARIFEKFGRAASTNYGGVGLGLYVVRKLVEAHGGTIDVASTPCEGSTFTVRLPR